MSPAHAFGFINEPWKKGAGYLAAIPPHSGDVPQAKALLTQQSLAAAPAGLARSPPIRAVNDAHTSVVRRKPLLGPPSGVKPGLCCRAQGRVVRVGWK